MTSHHLTMHPGDPGMGKETKGNRKGLGGDHSPSNPDVPQAGNSPQNPDGTHRAEDDEAVMKESPEFNDQGKAGCSAERSRPPAVLMLQPPPT
ncbi:MAG: hypothetical protein LC791_06665 [Acidobacteria bacterium]|nr:hypothetical protein [Acidobacteriota bacterium]